VTDSKKLWIRSCYGSQCYDDARVLTPATRSTPEIRGSPGSPSRPVNLTSAELEQIPQHRLNRGDVERFDHERLLGDEINTGKGGFMNRLFTGKGGSINMRCTGKGGFINM